MTVSFRQAKESDLEFLIDLRKKTMNMHLKNVGNSIDDKSHMDRIIYRFDAAKIVLVNNTNAGLLKSYCDEAGWVITQVQISPEYQGSGIGSKIVSKVLEQAADDDQVVTLSVLKGNPAKKLYSRLGFKVISKSDTEYTMLCKPNKKINKDT
jgi:ribosomal protein S18 acetylase RimI-like enzyme